LDGFFPLLCFFVCLSVFFCYFSLLSRPTRVRSAYGNVQPSLPPPPTPNRFSLTLGPGGLLLFRFAPPPLYMFPTSSRFATASPPPSFVNIFPPETLFRWTGYCELSSVQPSVAAPQCLNDLASFMLFIESPEFIFPLFPKLVGQAHFVPYFLLTRHRQRLLPFPLFGCSFFFSCRSIHLFPFFPLLPSISFHGPFRLI